MMKTVVIAHQPNTAVAAAVFVCLNIADAWLAQQLLALDGEEMFWWSAHFNSNMVIKGFLSLLIAFVLTRLSKIGLLRWLNIGMVLVVLSNGVCFLSYLISWLYYHTQIGHVA
jgi:hypothetical protein